MLGTGTVAPDFTIGDINGVEKHLDDLLANDSIILVFFKASCPTCQLTLPFLERLYAQRQPVFCISQDDARTTQAFVDRYQLTMPMLLDASRDSYPVSNAFGITNVPSLFEIEKDHAISWTSAGFVKKDLEALAHRRHIGIFHQDDNVPASKAG